MLTFKLTQGRIIQAQSTVALSTSTSAAPSTNVTTKVNNLAFTTKKKSAPVSRCKADKEQLTCSRGLTSKPCAKLASNRSRLSAKTRSKKCTRTLSFSDSAQTKTCKLSTDQNPCLCPKPPLTTMKATVRKKRRTSITKTICTCLSALLDSRRNLAMPYRTPATNVRQSTASKSP
jgi:hypothetical protein